MRSVLLLIAIAAAAPPLREGKPRKPTVELQCTPRVSIAGTQTVTITMTLRVTNVGEELYCPAVRWKLDGQEFGFHESDCRPYDSLEGGERGRAWCDPGCRDSELPRHRRLPAGTWTIKAQLERAGRPLKNGSSDCTVHIR